MALVLITAPTVEPVSLAEAKAHLRIDIDDDDTLIGGLITAARSHLENTARPKLAMINQTWEYIADSWPASDTLELRPYPLQSVTSITYTDASAVATVFSAANYVVDTSTQPGRLRLKTDGELARHDAARDERPGCAVRGWIRRVGVGGADPAPAGDPAAGGSLV